MTQKIQVCTLNTMNKVRDKKMEVLAQLSKILR